MNMSQMSRLSEMIGGTGGYLLDEDKWAVRSFEGVGKLKFRNRSESNREGFFAGQLLYGVTEQGVLVKVCVTEDGRLIPCVPLVRPE
jgi:hypothetical protein